METLKGSTYPGKFYLVREEDGKGHFYTSDPMHAGAEETDLASLLLDHYGVADSVNPLVIKVAGAVLERGRRFEISAPAKIRTGLVAEHFEDGEGHLVDVSAVRSPDSLFPINGTLYGRDGAPAGQRLYDTAGNCSDGERSHRLFIMEGVLSPVITGGDQETETGMTDEDFGRLPGGSGITDEDI